MKKRNYLFILGAIVMTVMFSGCAMKTSEVPVAEEALEDSEDQKAPNVEEAEEDENIDYSEETNSEISSSSSEMMTVEIGTNYENEYNEDGSLQYLKMEYPKIRLSENDRNTYSALADVLDAFSADLKKSFIDRKESALSDAIEQNEISDGFPVTYEDVSTIDLVRADAKVFSFWLDSSIYYGGAHGGYDRVGYNYDSSTGRVIELSEIISDFEGLYDLIDKKISAVNPELLSGTGVLEFTSVRDYINSSENNKLNFVLRNSGIDFIFNAYDLGSYADGSQYVSISFEELVDIISDKYSGSASGYIEYLKQFDETNIDGKSLYVTGEIDEYDFYENVTISYGDDEYVEKDFWGYSLRPIYVRTDSGKNFLILASKEESDYANLYCYDINDGIKKIGVIGGARGGVFDEKDMVNYEFFLTDPNNYRIDNRTDILGTQDIYRYYSVSDSGDFEPLTDYYTYCYPNEVTAKETITGIMVDNNFAEVDSLDIVSGEKVVPVYTDNETYVIVKNEKGELIKLSVDAEYPITINGTDTEQLFDNILYAG